MLKEKKIPDWFKDPVEAKPWVEKPSIEWQIHKIKMKIKRLQMIVDEYD